MTAREYLEKWRDHAAGVRILEEQVIYYTGVISKADSDELKRVCKRTIADYKKEIRTHKKKMQKIQNAVARLPDPIERQILQMRYLQPKAAPWETIAEATNYSYGNCHVIHRRALQHIADELRPN